MLWCCATSGTNTHALAFLIVELVAPDCMFNGLLWPEEEFNKTTVERDLKVKKRMDENPMLWDVMDMFADGNVFEKDY